MLHASLPTIDSRGRGARAVAHSVRDAATGAQQRDAAAALRTEALAVTAPWLAGLSAACAVAMARGLVGHVALPLLAGWAALVVAVNYVTVRARTRAAAPGAGAIARSPHWTILETTVHALVWGTLPALAMAALPDGARLLMAGAVVTLMSGAVLLALAPVAATLWVALLGLGLAAGARAAGMALPPAALLLVAAWLAAILVGCLTIERLFSRHIAEAAETRARYATVSALLDDYEEHGVGWLWRTDRTHLLTYASRFLCDLLGRSTRQLVGQSLPVALGCDAALGEALAAQAPFGPLEVTVGKEPQARRLALSGTPVLARDGSFEGFRGIGADVTEAHRSRQRLTELSHVDVLTGLPNRQGMRAILAEAIRAAGDGRPCAVLMLDIDRFRPVNDTFGHAAGDEVLRTVAARIGAAVGTQGRLGRVGADEFALLVHDGSSRTAVERLAEALVARAAEPMARAEGEVRVTIGIGAAMAPADGRSVDELLHHAELALVQAKTAGGDGWRLFEPRMQNDAADRLRLEQDLRHALRTGALRLDYQPIVSAATQAVVGFEALCRWRHPERGMIPPATFVPVAEQSGLIAELGEWVLQTACRDAMSWPDTMQLCVNLSGRQLVVPALADSVTRALAASRLPANRLELEVSEGIFAGNSEGALDVLRRIRALGVAVGLDDFGTGYSSLGYLAKAVFHTLKVDRTFVREAAENEGATAIIKAIVQLATSFRMTIVAEGIETPEDIERMRALGCQKLQGYLFGRPMPHADTLALVGARWERKAG